MKTRNFYLHFKTLCFCLIAAVMFSVAWAGTTEPTTHPDEIPSASATIEPVTQDDTVNNNTNDNTKEEPVTTENSDLNVNSNEQSEVTELLTNTRKNMVLLGGNMQFLSGSSLVENVFNVIARYGWNKSRYEWGPSLFLEGSNYGSGYDMSLLAGGFIDYNFIKNDSLQKNFIYGANLEVLWGNKRFAEGGNAQIGLVGLHGFATVFLNQSSVAIRTELGWKQKFIHAEKDKTSINGFGGKFAFVYYY